MDPLWTAGWTESGGTLSCFPYAEALLVGVAGTAHLGTVMVGAVVAVVGLVVVIGVVGVTSVVEVAGVTRVAGVSGLLGLLRLSGL